MKDANFLLACLTMILAQTSRDSTNPETKLAINHIAHDTRSVLKSFLPNPETRPMVCCPSCFQTYLIDENNPESYPEFCSHKDTPNSKRCRRRLRKLEEGTGKQRPIRRFIYHEFHHWLGRMYARSDIENHLDEYPPKHSQNEMPKVMKDMWDGYVLREFKGPDGKHFLDKPDDEGRLVFALNMDGFNPHGRRRKGRAAGICGIYLVCLNLPPKVRYKVENVFLVGIVPGPHEPSTHQVNHLLRPLVDDLLVLWSTGIYLQQTAKYPRGRLIRAALIPVVCDLPAARRVAGLGGHSATFFCSECLQTLNDINNLDTASWKARTYDEHCKHAQDWKDAPNESQREEVFQKYGAKWSELLRLPYWDPTKFLIIDSMHAFYLRLFSRHIREVWGMNVKAEDGESMEELVVSDDEIIRAEQYFRSGSSENMKSLNKFQLKYLCRESGLQYGGAKAKLVERLLQHVRPSSSHLTH